MMRAWIAVALLAASWLVGLHYFHQQPDWLAWIILVVAGAVLLSSTAQRPRLRWEAAVALLLVLPAVWVAPWPYKAAPALIAVGLLPPVLAVRWRWVSALGSGLLTAGLVLLAQGVAMVAYASLTARSHDLPAPLADGVGLLAKLLGAEAAVDQHDVLLHSMRRIHRLGATWELLLDPASFCFLAGGAALVVWRGGKVWRGLALLAGVMLAWLPVRCGLEMGLLLHRGLRTEYEEPLVLMNQFWNPWVGLVMLVPSAVLAWWWVGPRKLAESRTCEPAPVPGRSGLPRRLGAMAVAAAGVALVLVGWWWEAPGTRKTGLILVDELHSNWERTDRPMDTEWYGNRSSYNYACIYDYLSRFYTMGRILAPVQPADLRDKPFRPSVSDRKTRAIDDAVLKDCSILIIKTPGHAPGEPPACEPDERYKPEEVEAIVRFVRGGGGLMLVGEHTDVFHYGEYINAIASRFGFTYRYDCLFGADTPFTEQYQHPLVPHPIVAHVPPLDFEVSCSIAPGLSRGSAFMQDTGLWDLGPDYHATNLYPQVEDRPDARYGAWVQAWATRFGHGRVAAYADSTQFSNFSTFEPGKAEVMLGMIEWLSHRGGFAGLRGALIGIGAVLVGVALWLGLAPFGAGAPVAVGGGLMLLAAGLLGWSIAVIGCQRAIAAAWPLPQPVRPMVEVVMDRTVSNVALPVGGFIAGKEDGFGIFERWVLRLGYFLSRHAGDDALHGQLLVVLCPQREVPDDFRVRLQKYVEGGGKLLVIDTPANAASTANSLLFPFALAIDRTIDYSTGRLTTVNGSLDTKGSWPAVPINGALPVRGGEALARVGGKVVAARHRFGKGEVVAVGFGSRFTDTSMGVTGDLVPDAPMRNVYEVEYDLLRTIVEDH